MDRIKNKKAVIFDMDGTLVDNMPFHEKVWINFLHSHGITISHEEFQAQNHGNIDQVMRRFFGDCISNEQLKVLGQEKEQSYRDLYKEYMKEIDGLSTFLKKLKELNYKISLATMGDIPNINFVLNGLKIKEYFNVITGGHEIVRGKPDGEIFNVTLDKMKIKRGECIVIEDSIGGVTASLHAGIDVIGITTSHTAAELLQCGCIFTIDNYNNFIIS